MKIIYHSLKGKVLEKNEEPSKNDSAFTWQEVKNFNPEDVSELVSSQKWNSFIEENLRDGSRHTRAAMYDDTLYVEFPAIYESHGPLYPNIVVIIQKKLVTTLHKGPEISLEATPDAFAGRKAKASPELSLLYFILETYVHHGLSKTLKLRKSIHDLVQEHDADPTSVDMSALAPIKKAVGDLMMITEEQNYALRVLKNMTSLHFDFATASIYIGELLHDVRQILSTLGRQEDRVEELHTHHVLFLQDQTNSKLSTLTIVSAIFQPMALVAGIYGMNFKVMPELEWTYGYYLCLGLMFSISAGMLLLFWRRGWFQ